MFVDAVVTSIPYPDSCVTLKPLTVTQLFPEMTNALAWLLSVTVAPGAAVNTIGCEAVPDALTVTRSLYVPAETRTVVPATAFAFAALIVQNGCACVPNPVSRQAEVVLST